MNMQPPNHWAQSLRIRMPAQRAGLIEQTLDGEAVLYDCVTGQTHRMNETALAVWRACDGRQTTHDVADQLANVYAAPADVLLDDVEQLITAFARADLVRAHP